jgi:hypothetical protein
VEQQQYNKQAREPALDAHIKHQQSALTPWCCLQVVLVDVAMQW